MRPVQDLITWVEISRSAYRQNIEFFRNIIAKAGGGNAKALQV